MNGGKKDLQTNKRYKMYSSLKNINVSPIRLFFVILNPKILHHVRIQTIGSVYRIGLIVIDFRFLNNPLLLLLRLFFDIFEECANEFYASLCTHARICMRVSISFFLSVAVRWLVGWLVGSFYI